jgi:multiple antibiotic resistance protein
MLQVGLSSLVLLLVTIGPVEAAVIFAGLTRNDGPRERLKIAWRAMSVAGLVLLVFAFGGNGLLGLLNISLSAFRLAGGFLLLLVAVDLMFAHPTGLTSLTRDEAEEAGRRDIAVFPLAIPLIAGPGSIAASVLLIGEAEDWPSRLAVVGALLAVLGLTFASLLVANLLIRVLGVTGANVIARVSGLLLAALAMQLVIDGLKASEVFGPLSTG